MATSETFICSEWMPEITAPFTEEEISGVTSGLKSSSAPSPVNQISYTVIKRCPSLLPVLMHLYNFCWLTQEVPTAWKIGIVHLLDKTKAANNPSNPSNFHPIALTSCVSKVFTSSMKRRWLAYMVNNGFLNIATQKAFVDGVSECSEHYLKLLSILQEAERIRKSVCVAWLDLANAFRSMHHDLITFSLVH